VKKYNCNLQLVSAVRCVMYFKHHPAAFRSRVIRRWLFFCPKTSM